MPTKILRIWPHFQVEPFLYTLYGRCHLVAGRNQNLQAALLFTIIPYEYRRFTYNYIRVVIVQGNLAIRSHWIIYNHHSTSCANSLLATSKSILYFELIDALSVYVAADRSLDLSNDSHLLLVVESSELWSLQE